MVQTSHLKRLICVNTFYKSYTIFPLKFISKPLLKILMLLHFIFLYSIYRPTSSGNSSPCMCCVVNSLYKDSYTENTAVFICFLTSACVSCSWRCSSSVHQVTGHFSVTSVGFHSLKRATYWGTSNSTRERSPSNARSAAMLAAAATPWLDICAHTQVRLPQLYAIAIRKHTYGR